MHSTLYASDISFSYKTVSWNNFDFEVTQGECVSLIGGSGIGKTTLLRVLAGLQEYQKGTIYIDDKENKVRQPFSSVFIVFQDYNLTLLPWLTIKDNIKLGLHKSKRRDQSLDNLNSILAMLFPDNTDILHQYPNQLSGGQKQRVQIARALIANSNFIFFDEPDTGVDYKNKLALRVLINQLTKQKSKGIVIITHDLENAYEVSSRCYIIHKKEKNGNISLTQLPKDEYRNLEEFRRTVLEYI